MIEALPHDGSNVIVQQARTEEFADEEPHASSSMEVIHIGHSIGVDAGEQRGDVRKGCQIIPCENDARSSGHGNQMHGVVGGTARGHQADNAIDHGFFVIDL